MKPRKLAFDLLQKLEKQKQFSNILLDRALDSYSMNDADKGLVSALFYGVTERRITLDYQIARLSSRPMESVDPSALTAIRMGLYQLIYMDRIPPHAAINESVELCSKKLSGFVNAILRAYTRDPRIALPERSEPVRFISVKYSVCAPLAKKLIDAFGIDSAEAILEGFNRQPRTTVSVNGLKISRQELSQRIEGSVLTQYSDSGLYIRGSVRQAYGYDEGMFFVQDEASQICVQALDAKEGDTMIDVCSCPGSKSFGAAIAMKNKGRILAFDLHEKKLPLITEGAKRLGIDIISAAKRDGRDFLSELEGTADKVLCDVPCSGFGVLSKKPELRYKDPAESAALPQIQLSILNNACRYVKKGGVLVYSTCTIFPEENEKNIQRFLAEHKDFTLSPFSVGSLNVEKGYVTLLPQTHGTDGFFVARLIKI